MNGIYDLKIDGQVYPLKFGMHAIAALEQRTAKGGVSLDTTEGYAKFLSDLMYCGMYGNSVRNDLAIRPYAECMDLFELLATQDDAAEQYSAMTKCYFDSIADIRDKKDAKEDTDKKKAK